MVSYEDVIQTLLRRLTAVENKLATLASQEIPTFRALVAADLPLAPGFSVHKNATDQSIASTATWTKLTWSTEEYDTDSAFASNRFTVVTPGVYDMLVSVSIAPSAGSGRCIVSVYKNGAEYRRVSDWTDLIYSQGGKTTVKAAAGDYFEIYCYQTWNSNMVISGASYVTFWQCQWIGN